MHCWTATASAPHPSLPWNAEGPVASGQRIPAKDVCAYLLPLRDSPDFSEIKNGTAHTT